ncbi:hypothetical protein NEUTE1DRAFT_129457 [Neurospora tetrasperma FGSC 2508]|uniref:Uncharacterized protein n=1 Tax=Neurospora tetrasperma (strain FGSC 2508 / ATCC MYA-4615 / P0657) TaxID=510951 RepID=F8ML58_NEUT8|nr:uncharacterized protein NEUTE1DRAFT_129457 [Neurospora tetrasperma FGSC 2508]EGO57533.1 hypothetical protein NEUTE1DRAFT_129457 [Neurospora tetrasperma FGSC 2508]
MGNEIFGHSFTNSSDPNWVPEPGTRGTFSILSVCLVTLGLCVWTAIHLNVPEHNEPGWKQLMRKTGWLMLSLLSPEIDVPTKAVPAGQVAYTAYQQYGQASLLVRTMNKQKKRHDSDSDSSYGLDLLFGRNSFCESDSLCHDDSPSRKKGITDIMTSWLPCLSRRLRNDEEDPPSTTVHTVEKWTMVHGFLAAMGGIAIEIRDNDPEINVADRIANFLPIQDSQRQRTRLTLTPKGLQFLKEHGYEKLIPDLSENRIKDKSKASAFAKTLVCIQASWFCIQCLTRFAQGLAISLLELNTLGHAICTLFIYALWWNKPLDIVEPETVLIHPSTKRLDKKTAELDHLHFDDEMFTFPLYRSTEGSGRHFDLSGLPSKRIHYVYGQILLGVVPVETPILYLHVKQSSALLEKARLRPQKHDVIRTKSENERDRDWSAIELRRILQHSAEEFIVSRSVNVRDKESAIELQTQLHTRNSAEERPSSAFRSEDYSPNSASTAEMLCIVIRYSDIIRWQLTLKHAPHRHMIPPKDTFTDRVRNLPRFQDYDHNIPLFIGFGVVGLIYGGLHCVAWNAPFTTSVERILWRISSITIAATGVLVACVFSWTKLPPFWHEQSHTIWDIYDFLGDTSRKGSLLGIILSWCTGAKLATMLERLVKRQPLYKNNRLVKVLCDTALWALLLPYVLLLPLTILLLYLLKVLRDIFTILFMVLYVLARIYLVVISFINLAHLPDSAYQLPQWSRR